MKRRLLALLTVLALVISALIGCTGNSEGSKDPAEESTPVESSLEETEEATTEEPTTEEPTTEEVTEEPAVLTSVSVISDPQKTEYSVGEELDTTGLGLLLQFDNMKFERKTEGFTVGRADMNTPGKKVIDVTYEGFTAQFTVTVYPAPSRNVKVGDVVDFGPYTWKVLAKDGNKSLIITSDIIEVRTFHAHSGSPWASSAMRDYLNGTIYAGFSEDARNRIVETEVTTPDSTIYKISGGPTSQDYIFLLSSEEAREYFPDDASRIASYRGTVKNWWLRSPGCGSNIIVFINEHGEIFDRGVAVSDTNGVRPALWAIL